MDVIEQYKNSRKQLFDRLGTRVASKTSHVNGPVKKVHYLEAGSGKPLILLHGGGSSSAEWFNIVEPLSRQFHLCIVDRPGSGLSDPFNYRGIDLMEHAADFIRSFMDSLGLRKAIFLAQSRDCEFHVVEDAGHCPWLDQPEICASLIIDLLK